MSKLASLTGALILISSPAVAQDARDIAKADTKKADVSRIVCQKEEQIGTRLAAKKVCLTVKEWQERAQLNREETERAQLNTWVRSGG
jgi:riboflavin synthase alpha subunit